MVYFNNIGLPSFKYHFFVGNKTELTKVYESYVIAVWSDDQTLVMAMLWQSETEILLPQCNVVTFFISLILALYSVDVDG